MAKKESLSDRVPPQAIEIEMAVLGSMMLDTEAAFQVLEILTEPDFYRTAHQKIFSSITSLLDKSEAVDMITVSEVLNKRNMLEDIGGEYYLSECINMVTATINVKYHSEIIYEKSLLRRLIKTSNVVSEEAYSEAEDAINILDKAEQKIFEISGSRHQKGFQQLKPVMMETIGIIDKFQNREGETIGTPTGYMELDKLTGGFQPGELIIVAGRPGMGKTAFALSAARNAAIDHEIGAGFFSLEMANNQLTMRLLCSEARINQYKIRNQKLTAQEWQELTLNAGKLSEAQMFIDDSSTLTLMEMRAKARRLKLEHDVGIIYVDYLQLMQGPRNIESRQQEISTISRGLKAMAKDLEVPVVALSQLSRAVESRGGDKKPMLSDLRESGAIEQDADVVLFVYRPEVYKILQDDEGNSLENMASIIIGKQRNGPTGEIGLVFLKEFMRFENMEHLHEQEAPF